MANILVCDDEVATINTLQKAFTSDSHAVTVVNDVVDAIRIVYPSRFHVLFIGVDMQKPQVVMRHVAGLRIIRESDPKLRIVILGRGNSLELEREFRMEGIFCYCLKPVDPVEATEILMDALHAESAAMR
ncbi:MAG: response regulator [candidate division KSB1 bacterium]|nr:response regulator [candidate division KSB1 bacterium]MDZ7303759.1 response regulator [candidate division KSB1 bacterium]MDZ7313018.1 response regulator [candidate division KSB1 bacterium]